MTTHLTRTWSENLLNQTRDAIEQILVTPDGQLHFRHPTLGYAYATIDDLVHDRLVLRSKAGSDEYRFAEVDALLHAGWAVLWISNSAPKAEHPRKHDAHILKIKATGPSPVFQTAVA